MKTKEDFGIGERLKQLAYQKNLSNSDLARIAGVTGQAIGDILNGKTMAPKVDLIIALSNYLDVSLDWLLLGEGQMFKDSASSAPSSFPLEETVRFQAETIVRLTRMLEERK